MSRVHLPTSEAGPPSATLQTASDTAVSVSQTEQAKATASKIETELADLKATLQNIEQARPFNQLSTDDVIKARPEIGRTVEEMVKKGKWSTPGYDATFGNLS